MADFPADHVVKVRVEQMKNSFVDYERKAYDSKLFAQRHWHRKRIAETLSALGHSERLLDLGCGSALLAERADANFIVGADVDKETLIINNRRDFGRIIHFVVADATTLPFRDGSFDAVSSSEVIEHVRNPERMIEDVSRVLAPGGRAVITTPSYRSLWFFIEKLWSMRARSRDYVECHVSHFTKSSLIETIEKGGLRVTESRTIHALVMLHPLMKTLLGWLDNLLARAGFGVVVIVSARKDQG